MKVLLVFLATIASACGGVRIDPQFSPEPRLEATIDALGAEVMKLRLEIDSLVVLGDSLRRDGGRMRRELQAREASIVALQVELQRLKEIDLKPRPSRPKHR